MRAMMENIQTQKSKSRGFTLIEMAVSMVILGILFSAAIPLYRLYIEETRAETTRQRLATAHYELEQYKKRMGAYPCPASLTDTLGTPSYGQPSNCLTITTPAGSCAGGICAEDGVLNVKPDTGPSYIPYVLRGSLPFRALGLRESDGYDAYGSRLVYAVTQNLADPTKFDEDEGGIQLVDGNNALITTSLPDVGSAQFVVISAGPDKVGGYTRDGVQSSSCTGGTLQVENCDTTNQAIYRVSQKNSSAVNFFDDGIVYNALRQPVLWRYTGGFTDVASKDLKIVGVGTVPNSGETLALNGNLKVTAGDVAGPSNYCEPNGTNCFPRALLGNGATDGAACPPNEFMTGFQGGSILCTPNPVVGCPAGERLIGFDSYGLPICNSIPAPPPPACPPQSVNVCAGAPAQTLPASPSGVTSRVQWNSRFQDFDCVNGVWVGQGWHGSCSCSVGITAYPVNSTYCVNHGMSGPYQTGINVTACGASYAATPVVVTPCLPPVSCTAFSPIICAGTPVATPFPLPPSSPGQTHTSPVIGVSRTQSYTCQSNGVWTQSSASGTCVAPLDCPSQPATICGTSATLTANVHGSYQTLTHSPDRAEQYQCNNGTWVATGNVTGSCTPYLDCPASTDTVCTSHNVSLPADIHGATYVEPYGNAGYTCNNGTWVQTTSPTCPVNYYCDWQITGGSGYPTPFQGGNKMSGDTCPQSSGGTPGTCMTAGPPMGFKGWNCRCTCVVVP